MPCPSVGWSCAEEPQDLQALQSDAKRLGAERFGAEFVADAGKGGGDGASKKRIYRRRDEILEELESLDEASFWGVYTEGDGLGVNVALYIAPSSGAAYTFHGCMGLYDGNYGDVLKIDGRTIYLDLAVNPRSNRRWYPARCGNR